MVVLSQHADEAYAFHLLKNGTAGLAYLLKERVGDLGELLRALPEVIAGRSVIDPEVVETLIARRTRLNQTPLSELSSRELDVLGEMAQGKIQTLPFSIGFSPALRMQPRRWTGCAASTL